MFFHRARALVYKNELSCSLLKSLQSETMEYAFRGRFDVGVNENIMSLAETNLLVNGEITNIKKRIYFILVECLQNITRHQQSDNADCEGFVNITRAKDAYYISTGNCIAKSMVDKLLEKLNYINSLNSETLKDYSRAILLNGRISSQGGAGLGLTEIARKSGCKFQWEFIDSDNDNVFFYLNICVPFIGNAHFLPFVSPFGVNNYARFNHRFMVDNNIILMFGGILNQNGLINLISVLGRQMAFSKLMQRRVYSVMVELLQNVSSHGESINSDYPSAYGLFYIKTQGDHLIISTGNYIKSSSEKSLAKLLDKINDIKLEKLPKLLRRSDTRAIGLIQLRIMSKNQYKYSFEKINDDFSFFMIDVFLECK